MKELLTISENTFYRKNDDDEMTRFHEICIVVSEPKYKHDAGGQMIKERCTETFRFAVLSEGLELMGKQLISFTLDDKKE